MEKNAIKDGDHSELPGGLEMDFVRVKIIVVRFCDVSINLTKPTITRGKICISNYYQMLIYNE
tara:strand:- start:1048 stop:1236 length:189 start_codon:yes stop_codon:yes gene_type:complete